MSVDIREFGYVPVENWAKLPPGFGWPEVAGVATDSRDRVFVFNRGDHPVIVFDRDGLYLFSWGEGVFARPHGITLGPDDSVYCTDDMGHCVRKFTPDGQLLMTLGTPGRPSDTGATSIDFRTIKHSGPPFHYPTNLALDKNGDMFISDGYGNACVHHFAPDGRLIDSWGEPGDGKRQFHVPHGIAIDSEGIIWVADRENSRIVRYARNGEIISEDYDVARPSNLFVDVNGDIYIAELGYRAGMWPGTSPPTPDATGGRVSIFERTGKLKARWGGGDNPCAPGDFFAPHDICVDSHGDIYVAEVTWSGGANRGLVSADCHALQKFIHIRAPHAASLRAE